MHVYLSDLHLAEGTAGAVSDALLTKFLHTLEERSVNEDKITLVFVGDVMDLLRSERWEALWIEANSAPWSGMGPGFANFADGHAEHCALEIAKSIQSQYGIFSTKLKTLVQSKKFETKYVFGNHDYMFQLSRKLREVLTEFLTLGHDPAKPFDSTYADKNTSVYATHGHSVDAVNWHREAPGYWAIGDAIVLRIVNRFPALACQELGVAPTTQTGRLLHQIDNIEPISDIPLYVRWLSEGTLAIAGQQKKVEEVWATVVNDFLSLSDFQDGEGYGSGAYQAIRQAFRISTSATLTHLLGEAAKLFPFGGQDYLANAQTLAHSLNYRFIVFGHTHQPMLIPLSVAGSGPTFYVNTGCWRKIVVRASKDSLGSFVPRRISSYFEVGDGAVAGDDRYHLNQAWHVN